mmetsp:Transcript_2141/g.3182  ORF Transcript_2141/g.3182 Transcript_2141/m.3182 type:complete len:659 (-) Transcript_2141:416-2392(-)
MDSTMSNTLLMDPSTIEPVGNYAFKREAQVIPTITGSLSAISSFLIIVIILRTNSKLSSPYHVIMFIMSLSVMISSSAFLLTTLPMPKDAIYPFYGNTVGTKATCTAQGSILMGTQVITGYMCLTLCLFYVYTIRYERSDIWVKKCFLPIMVTISCIHGLFAAVVPASLGLVNPQPFQVFCYLGSYPFNYREYEYECLEGCGVSVATELIILFSSVVSIGVGFVVIIVALVLVVMSVFDIERSITKRGSRAHAITSSSRNRNNDSSFLDNDNDDEPDESSNPDSGDSNSRTGDSQHSEEVESKIVEYKNTRTVLRIALLYIGSFFLSYIWFVLAITHRVRVGPNDPAPGSFWQFNDRAKYIFTPLQGFLNALIFLYNKVHILRSSNRFVSVPRAIVIVMFMPDLVPEMLLSRIEVVANDERARNLKKMEENMRMQAQNQAESTPSIRNPSINFESHGKNNAGENFDPEQAANLDNIGSRQAYNNCDDSFDEDRIPVKTRSKMFDVEIDTKMSSLPPLPIVPSEDKHTGNKEFLRQGRTVGRKMENIKEHSVHRFCNSAAWERDKQINPGSEEVVGTGTGGNNHGATSVAIDNTSTLDMDSDVSFRSQSHGASTLNSLLSGFSILSSRGDPSTHIDGKEQMANESLSTTSKSTAGKRQE